MKKMFLVFGIMTFLFSGNLLSQKVDFKLISAIKNSELLIERNSGSELFNEFDVLPEGKKYLLIIAEITNNSEQRIILNSKNVTLGEEKIQALGNLSPCGRALIDFSGYQGDLFQGKNNFIALFIVNSELTDVKLHINQQSFAIENIENNQFPLFCEPKATLVTKEYPTELTLASKYDSPNVQPFQKVFKPKSGKILKLSTTIEFCDKAPLNESNTFWFKPNYFQIEFENGAVFDCIGTLSNGKLRTLMPHNIGSRIELKSELVLIFSVPNEEKCKLKYLGKVISEI